MQNFRRTRCRISGTHNFVAHYNGVRLHSAIGYITPDDFLAGKAKEIWAERDRRLEAARERRRQLRKEARLKDAS